MNKKLDREINKKVSYMLIDALCIALCFDPKHYYTACKLRINLNGKLSGNHIYHDLINKEVKHHENSKLL